MAKVGSRKKKKMLSKAKDVLMSEEMQKSGPGPLARTVMESKAAKTRKKKKAGRRR